MSMTEAPALRIGYVPEHFSAPLYFATHKLSHPYDLQTFPAGTATLISALQDNTIDVAIGLTEGFVNGLARAKTSGSDAGFSLVGTYVESPLRWAVSTGGTRTDIATEADPGEWVKSLKGKKIGVSRVGSGSYVMGYVMADKLGWLDGESKEPFEVVELGQFENLRNAVADGTADFFMWEHFTSKRYFDDGSIKKVGEILTPWPSWMIAARSDVEEAKLKTFFERLDQGVQYFHNKPEESVEYNTKTLTYSKEDAEEWAKTVQFAPAVEGVKSSVVDETLKVLKKAKVVDDQVKSQGMIRYEKKESGLLSAITGSG